jgi:hypothetical protein
MILVVTNSEDVTADYLCSEHLSTDEFVRLDTDTAVAKCSIAFQPGTQCSLNFERNIVEASDIHSVWYRRPGAVDIATIPVPLDEAEARFVAREWAEAIESYLGAIPEPLWVNHPRRNLAASSKMLQLDAARRVGLDIPRTLVSQDPNDVVAFFRKADTIIKPLTHGFLPRAGGGKESSLIYTSAFDPDSFSAGKLRCPTLFQERITKKADARIVVMDRTLVCVEISNVESDGRPRLDVRQDMVPNASYRLIHDIPNRVRHGILAMMSEYHLRFGAFDFAVSEAGSWVFLELNPNGNWAWLDIDAGASIGSRIAEGLRLHQGST